MVETTAPAKTDPAPTEVLTIEELAPSAGIVRINGETHDLANTRVFGLRRRAELQALIRRIDELERSDPDKLTEADEAEYEKRLRQVAAIALPTATEILAKLSVEQIGDIVIAFFVWAAANDPRMKMVRSLTSLMPSPGSNASTAGIR